MIKLPTVLTYRRVEMLNVKALFRNIPTISTFNPRHNVVLTYGIIADCLQNYVSATRPHRTKQTRLDAYGCDTLHPVSTSRLVFHGHTEKTSSAVYRRITDLIKDGVVDPTLTNVMNNANPYNHDGWYSEQTSAKAPNTILIGKIWMCVNGKTYSFERYRDFVLPNLLKKHTYKKLPLDLIKRTVLDARGAELIGEYDDVTRRLSTYFNAIPRTVKRSLLG